MPNDDGSFIPEDAPLTIKVNKDGFVKDWCHGHDVEHAVWKPTRWSDLMNRESSHWTVAAWVAGLILILTMAGGGLFMLARHDVHALVHEWNPSLSTVFNGIEVNGGVPVLKFDIILSARSVGLIKWQVWPFREIESELQNFL